MAGGGEGFAVVNSMHVWTSLDTGEASNCVCDASAHPDPVPSTTA